MKLKDILATGITGTTFMTLFSYILAEIEKKDYKEPHLLGKLIDNLAPGGSDEVVEAEGWAAHYAVGMAFALVYVKLWDDGKVKPNFINGLILGTASGALAMAVWKLTFKMHPLPPKTDYKNYYGQLLPAHIVFALFATAGYQLSKKIGRRDMPGNKFTAVDAVMNLGL